MQYRKFGNTNLQVSEVGFGAWAIGGSAVVGNTPIGWGKADDKISKEAITTAIEAGINFFDTADFYGLGHSEILLGEALKRNKNIIIATKVGHRNINNAITLDYSKKYILKACEASLKRLQRETIDYYQLHSARLTHLQNGECIEAMQILKRQGKIRYWGLSLNTFYPEAEADFLMQNNFADGFQLVFNIINQRAYNLINKAGQKSYGIIARMPLQFGLLTGKFSSTTSFNADDHRSFRLTPEVLKQTLSLLENKVWTMAKEENLNETQLALSFILSNEYVSTIIPGIRTPEHVEKNSSGLKKLSEKNLNYLLSLAGNELKPIMELIEKTG
jgi:aryl-alcohol dehydrogenase-like predicted oxidoreductase